MRSKRLGILLWSSNLWLLADGLLGPALTIFGTKKAGGDLMGMSEAVALYWTVNGAVEMIVGKICKKPSTMQVVMLIGFILNTASTFSYMAVETMAQVFLIQIMVGISRGLAGPTWDALYQLANSGDNVANAWGKARGMGSISMAISIFACGWIIGQEENYSRAFLIMGIIQTLATLLIASITWHRVDSEKNGQ